MTWPAARGSSSSGAASARLRRGHATGGVTGDCSGQAAACYSAQEAFPFVKGSCLAFVVKAGAIRVARNGVTVRPLAEEALTLKTYLSRWPTTVRRSQANW